MNWENNKVPDAYNLAVTAAEQEMFSQAKLEALTNHVLRFSSQVRGLVAAAIDRDRRNRLHSFDVARFERELEKVRPTLDGFYNDRISLDDAEAVLRPIVLDSLSALEIRNAFSFTRDALRSIEKIRI